jgi:NitT/TauT family transport system permease protein
MQPAHRDVRSPTKKKIVVFIKAAAYFLAVKIVQIAGAVIVWQLAVTALAVDPRIVPAPGAIAVMLWAQITSGAIVRAGWVTLQETVIGFVIGSVLGIGLAVLLSEVTILRRVLQPYIVALQAVPKVAVTPLFLIWFGFGLESKVALVVTILFFPVLVNTMAGLASTSEDQIELMRAYGATRWQMLTRLKFYVALPYVFAAFEVSLVLALTAAVVAELLGSGTLVGLGTLIKIYDARMNSAGMWAVLIVLSLLGVAMHGLVVQASKWLMRWDRKA